MSGDMKKVVVAKWLVLHSDKESRGRVLTVNVFDSREEALRVADELNNLTDGNEFFVLKKSSKI